MARLKDDEGNEIEVFDGDPDYEGPMADENSRQDDEAEDDDA